MKYTDQFFKFPVKVYSELDWKKIEEIEKTEDSTGADLSEEKIEPPYARGWKYVNPEDIVSISPTFSYFRNIHDVNEEGFDMTRLDLKYGQVHVSSWPLNKFMDKLNEFYNNINLMTEKDQKDRIDENIKYIKQRLLEEIQPVLELYKESGIKDVPGIELITKELKDLE